MSIVTILSFIIKSILNEEYPDTVVQPEAMDQNGMNPAWMNPNRVFHHP